MSFRTNLRGLCAGVRRNLIRNAYRTYKISQSPLRAIQPLLLRNDKAFLPFAFILLPFTLFIAACSWNPNLQGKGEIYLQGEWQQDSSAVQQKLITFSAYRIKFDCDSFYMQIHSRSAVNYGSDTCRKNGQWAEYIKGAYRQRNDTLFMKGQFCNANFSLKTNTDCFRVGPYEELFRVSKKSGSLVQLSGTSNVIPVQLKLIKLTTCTQKPL